jgi:hypothetical protein
LGQGVDGASYQFSGCSSSSSICPVSVEREAKQTSIILHDTPHLRTPVVPRRHHMDSRSQPACRPRTLLRRRSSVVIGKRPRIL